MKSQRLRNTFKGKVGLTTMLQMTMNFFACFYLTVHFIDQGWHLVLSEVLILLNFSARRN